MNRNTQERNTVRRVLRATLAASALAFAFTCNAQIPVYAPSDFEFTTKDGDPRVSRAFFYNGETVIEFDTYPLHFSVVDSRGNLIPFRREGRYVRLSGNQNEFLATIDGKKVEFSSLKMQAAKAKAEAAKNAAATPAPAPVPAQASQKVFKALASDVNIRGALNRWSREMGMQEVIWQIPGDDIPVDREVTFTTNFDESVAGLMMATNYTKQPARACSHSNGVIRVIPRTRFCDQP